VRAAPNRPHPRYARAMGLAFAPRVKSDVGRVAVAGHALGRPVAFAVRGVVLGRGSALGRRVRQADQAPSGGRLSCTP